MNNDFPTDGPDSVADVEKRPSEVALDAMVRKIQSLELAILECDSACRMVAEVPLVYWLYHLHGNKPEHPSCAVISNAIDSANTRIADTGGAKPEGRT